MTSSSPSLVLLTTCYIILLLLSGDHNTKYFSFVSAVEYGQITTCPEVPSLHCKNGSTCTPGVASFGSQHDHLVLQTHDSGYHCKCPIGYIGHECEIYIQECSSSTQHVCYNGSECQSNNKSCDCNTLNVESKSTDTKYAGDMCQHISTSFCAVTLVGNHAPNHQFCTNHGECVRLVSGRDAHPGCICKDGYTGDHCEVQSDAFGIPQSSSRGNDVSTLSKTMFGVMIVVMIVVTASIVYFLGTNRRKDKASWRENYNPESSSSPESSSTELTSNSNNNSTTTTETTSSLRKTQVGEGELDPDGSGTMMFEIGSPGVIMEDDDVSVNSENEKSNGVTAGKEIV